MTVYVLIAMTIGLVMVWPPSILHLVNGEMLWGYDCTAAQKAKAMNLDKKLYQCSYTVYGQAYFAPNSYGSIASCCAWYDLTCQHYKSLWLGGCKHINSDMWGILSNCKANLKVDITAQLCAQQPAAQRMSLLTDPTCKQWIPCDHKKAGLNPLPPTRAPPIRTPAPPKPTQPPPVTTQTQPVTTQTPAPPVTTTASPTLVPLTTASLAITLTPTIPTATQLINLPSGHAQSGYYPNLNTNTCGLGKQPVNSRIVDGVPAAKGEYPYMVGVYQVKDPNSPTLLCGGAIIHTQYVLTVKHCLGFDLATLKVYVGSLERNKFEHQYDVEKVFLHHDLDIGLIKLKQPILTATDTQGLYTVNSICLPVKDSTNTQTEHALLVGFGYTDIHRTNPSDVLRQTPTLIESVDICRTKYKVQSDEICGFESKHMMCNGDSGSPLVQYNNNRAVIIGVAYYLTPESGQPECGEGLQRFARVSMFIDWLEDMIYPKSEPNQPQSNQPNQQNNQIITTGPASGGSGAKGYLLCVHQIIYLVTILVIKLSQYMLYKLN